MRVFQFIICINILVMLHLAMCRQADPVVPEPCEVDQLGRIRIQNFNNDRYRVEIVGLITVTVDGNGTVDIDQVPAKTYPVNFQNLRSGSTGHVNGGLQVSPCATNLLPIIF